MGDNLRQQILDTALSKNDELYAGHLKIYEDDDQAGLKSRYILLSYGRTTSRGFIHKSKLNPSGSFSIGKTWKLEDLRGLEVLDPLVFKISLSRTYQWRTENEHDQSDFLAALVELFRRLQGAEASLNLIGIPAAASYSLGVSGPSSSQQQSTSRSQTPTQFTPSPAVSPRRQPIIRSPTERSASPSQNPRDRLQNRLYASSNGGPGSSVSVNSSNPSVSASSIATPSRTYEDRRRLDMRGTASERTPSRVRGDRKLSTENARPSFEREREREAREREAREREAREREEREQEARDREAREREREAREREERRREVEAMEQERELERERERDRARDEKLERLTRKEQERSRRPNGSTQQDARSDYEGRTTPNGRVREPIQDRLRNGAAASRSTSSLVASEAESQRAPSPPQLPSQPSGIKRPDPHARISYFDPPNQALADRLLFGASEGIGAMGEEDPAESAMANVEEMLEGIEWGFAGGYGTARKKGRTGAADMIEARLMDELMALEKANIHSFLETDDRVADVLQFLDDAIKELDDMNGYITAYKTQLNAVNDDISHIQSQDRGLQVQTQNQKALLQELENLLQTVDVDRTALIALTQESLESDKGIQRLEMSAAELYKALMAGREHGMAAGMERLDEYRTHNAQFCKRLLDFLNIAFRFKSDKALSDGQRGEQSKNGRPAPPTLLPHRELETYLGRYCGLMLYLKEMDEDKYSKVCATYFSISSDLHSKEMKSVFMAYMVLIKSPEEDGDAGSFSAPVSQSAVSRAGGTIRRAKTKARSIADRRDRNKVVSGDLVASDALLQLMDLVIPQISREQDFLADFLQISDASFTFADYIGLENYFKRKAAASAGDLRPATVKLIRGAMDLIFGFLPEELKNWIDAALQRDSNQIIGIMAAIEQSMAQAEDRGNLFTQRLLSKQHQRAIGLFNRYVNDQIEAIEHTKLTTKKRNGVSHFVKHFPVYVERIESQLSGMDTMEIRTIVDGAYEKITHTMFESLQQMAKMEDVAGEAQLLEDKGMLNYHVIMIENMQYFVSEIKSLELMAVLSFSERAQSIYDENLNAYVKLVLRKSFAKIIDFFDGVERLLQTVAPTEVIGNSAYNRSSLKRIVKEYDAKDVRKNIEALFKRVEKHFDDDGEMVVSATNKVVNGTVMAGVWVACEDKLAQETQRFMRIIGQCYKDSGVALDFTDSDVRGAFRKHRT